MAQWKDPRYVGTQDKGGCGFMTEEHTVWCGGCAKWQQFPGGIKEVYEAAKRDGWKKSGLRGWMCRSCYGQGRALELPEEN